MLSEIASEVCKACLGLAGLGCSVNGYQSEGHGIALLPLKIIQKAPVEVALYRKPVADTVLYA